MSEYWYMVVCASVTCVYVEYLLCVCVQVKLWVSIYKCMRGRVLRPVLLTQQGLTKVWPQLPGGRDATAESSGLRGCQAAHASGVLAFHKGKDALQLKRTLRNGAIVFRVRFGDQNLWLLIERLHMAGEGRLHSPQHDHTYTMLQGL